MTNPKPGDLILATDTDGFTGPAMWGHDLGSDSTLFTPGDPDKSGWANRTSYPSVGWQAITVAALSARIEQREDGPVVIVMHESSESVLEISAREFPYGKVALMAERVDKEA